MEPVTDPLKDLPRLGEDALGPCLICDRVMLETELPLFFRFKVKRCGIDANEVGKHVGFAQMMGGGANGFALASIMGPGTKPVVVLDDWDEVNVCGKCAATCTAEMLTWKLMVQCAEEEKPDV